MPATEPDLVSCGSGSALVVHPPLENFFPVSL